MPALVNRRLVLVLQREMASTWARKAATYGSSWLTLRVRVPGVFHAATQETIDALQEESEVSRDVCSRGHQDAGGQKRSNYRPHACQAPEWGSKSRQDDGKPLMHCRSVPLSRFVDAVICRVQATGESTGHSPGCDARSSSVACAVFGLAPLS